MSIISNIVNRCHVGDSNQEVILYAISRLNNKMKGFKSMPIKDQRMFCKTCQGRTHGKSKSLPKGYIWEGLRRLLLV